jgi:hypothetical protein
MSRRDLAIGAGVQGDCLLSGRIQGDGAKVFPYGSIRISIGVHGTLVAKTIGLDFLNGVVDRRDLLAEWVILVELINRVLVES